jgi:hypothetical protein
LVISAARFTNNSVVTVMADGGLPLAILYEKICGTFQWKIEKLEAGVGGKAGLF